VFSEAWKNHGASPVGPTDFVPESGAVAILRPGSPRGRLRGMSSLSALPTDPKELRPLLHAEVDKLGDENLVVLHWVALELELEEVADRLNAGFDADRAAGKLARLPEIIRAARAALSARQSR